MKVSLRMLLPVSLLFLASCATTSKNIDFVEAKEIDKFEPFNRAMFNLNMKMDRWFLKPVAKGYDWVTPRFVQGGIRNIFDNIGEVGNVVNDTLQWKWRQAGNDSARFLTNSTVGLLGLFDVAEKIGFEASDGEDFGQTFAKWGMGQGSYLVLPFWGPTTVRDGFGLPGDWLVSPTSYITPNSASYAVLGVDLVDSRAQLLATEDLASGDLYLFVRDIYLQRRDYLINDGAIAEDTFGEEDF